MSNVHRVPTIKQTLLNEKDKTIGSSSGVPEDWRAHSTIPPKWAHQIIGVSLTSFYEAVSRGDDIPTRKIGRRLVVPVQGLRRWLGELPESEVSDVS